MADPKYEIERPTLGDFWGFVMERQRIWYRREVLKLDPPWTDDPILRTRHFTNIFRAQDKGTIWFRNMLEAANVRGCCGDVLWRSVIYRLVNKIDTFEKVGFPSSLRIAWQWVNHELTEFGLEGNAIHTRRHQVRGLKGLRNAVWALTSENYRLGVRLVEAETGPDVMGIIRTIPDVGPFFGNQVLQDLIDADVLSPAISEYVAVGPGAVAGLKLLKGEGDPKSVNDRILLMADNQPQWRPAGIDEGFFTLPRLKPADIEHTLCEFARYWAIKNGARSPKTLPSSDQLWWAQATDAA